MRRHTKEWRHRIEILSSWPCERKTGKEKKKSVRSLSRYVNEKHKFSSLSYECVWYLRSFSPVNGNGKPSQVGSSDDESIIIIIIMMIRNAVFFAVRIVRRYLYTFAECFGYPYTWTMYIVYAIHKSLIQTFFQLRVWLLVYCIHMSASTRNRIEKFE